MAVNSTDPKLGELLQSIEKSFSTQFANLNEQLAKLRSNVASESHSDDFGTLSAAEVELVKTHRQTQAAASGTQQSQTTPDISTMSASEVAKLPPETITQLFRECGQVLAGGK
jgi:hypothetical protein